MPEITLNLTADEAQGILGALSKFSIEQAGNLYGKVQYQIAVQMQAANQTAKVPEGPAPSPAADSDGGSTD